MKNNTSKYGIGSKALQTKFGLKGRVKVRSHKNGIVLVTADYRPDNVDRMTDQMHLKSFPHTCVNDRMHPSLPEDARTSYENLTLIYFFYDIVRQIIVDDDEPSLALFSTIYF